MSTQRACPVCGRTMEQGCLPSSCPAWTQEAVYDHETRQWVPVDADGYALDGRPAEDVR